MANDRVMLKCTVCMERFCMLRYSPTGGAQSLEPSWVLEQFEAWLKDHCAKCHGAIWTNDLEGDPRFVTETE